MQNAAIAALLTPRPVADLFHPVDNLAVELFLNSDHAVVGVAPCQCFSPGGNQTTSPGRMSSIGPPSRCTQPLPAVTINVWPSGCVCHAVRAAGSNVTLAPAARAGACAWNNGSMRTVPVNQSAGPLLDGCEPILFISMFHSVIRHLALFRVSSFWF